MKRHIPTIGLPNSGNGVIALNYLAYGLDLGTFLMCETRL